MKKTILSFDVGIVNLSYCILEKIDDKISIKKWDIINLNNTVDEKICITCNKKALYGNKTIDNIENYYCKKHCINKELNFNDYCIENKDENKCNHIIHKSNKECTNKNYYKFSINDKCYCKKHMTQLFTNIEKSNKIKKIEKPINSYDDIIHKLIFELDNRKELLECDDVIIENQPSMKNPKMKSIAMTIYNYYLIRGVFDGIVKKVKFISPINKLKNINTSGKKLSYKDTKQLSIDYCTTFIKEYPEWDIFFNKSKKKDDLSDALLQCIYYINI